MKPWSKQEGWGHFSWWKLVLPSYYFHKIDYCNSSLPLDTTLWWLFFMVRLHSNHHCKMTIETLSMLLRKFLFRGATCFREIWPLHFLFGLRDEIIRRYLQHFAGGAVSRQTDKSHIKRRASGFWTLHGLWTKWIFRRNIPKMGAILILGHLRHEFQK